MWVRCSCGRKKGTWQLHPGVSKAKCLLIKVEESGRVYLKAGRLVRTHIQTLAGRLVMKNCLQAFYFCDSTTLGGFIFTVFSCIICAESTLAVFLSLLF